MTARRTIVSLVLLWLPIAPTSALADCARDIHGEVICGAGECDRDQRGEVWCSRSVDGGVARTRTGDIVCGRGQCVTSTRGGTYCSSIAGGAALKDSRGRARCEGRCEPASAQHCERVVADSAE